MGGEMQIKLHEPLLGKEEENNIVRAIQDFQVGPEGSFLLQFEKDLKEITSSPHVSLLQSGTAALHLILKALKISEGDSVIIPTHTFIATGNPLLYEKINPVLVDSEEESFNLSPEYLKQAIEDLTGQNKKPKAVILVHMYGLAGKIRPIKEITDFYGIPLIEDAAESFGTYYEGRHTGTFGDFGFLSFNANKVITTGGGGAVLTKNQEKAERIKFLATQARENKPYYFHKTIGFNYAMHNIQAAMGVAQIRKLDLILKRKRKIHSFYQSLSQELPFETIDELSGSTSNYWLNLILLDKNRPDDFIQYLKNNGIEARHTWFPLHKMPLFEKFPYYGNDESEKLFEKGVLLPSSPGLTGWQLDYISEKIKSFFKNS